MICGFYVTLKRMDRSTTLPLRIEQHIDAHAEASASVFVVPDVYEHYFHLQHLSALLPTRSGARLRVSRHFLKCQTKSAPQLPNPRLFQLIQTNLSQVVLLSPGRSPKQMYERARKMFSGVIELIRICLSLADTKPREHFVSQESSLML